MFLVLSATGHADSKFYSGSTTDSNFKFNRKEKIILALPHSPTVSEKEFVNRLRQYLVDHKFILVDSISQAERILTFRITENANMNFQTTYHTAWMQDLKSGIPSVQGGKISSNIEDSGYTFLEISMQDIELIKTKDRSTIWQCFISTKEENFKKYPDVVLENLMKLYGKNEVRDGKIKKPRK
jgi:hypothetical protein